MYLARPLTMLRGSLKRKKTSESAKQELSRIDNRIRKKSSNENPNLQCLHKFDKIKGNFLFVLLLNIYNENDLF